MAVIWELVLWIAIVTFGLMVAVCGWRGFGDILDLFRTLNEEAEADEAASASAGEE
ncbi:MAG: hypothetical protein J7M26_07655 [Armatimonadetes bacterium]|nr:hypothetical protein [Armatimonadota bacterium]